jgi:hypothetical protein
MACNASSQCGSGGKCCGVSGAGGIIVTGYQCQQTCAANSPTIGCDGPATCPKGDICCATSVQVGGMGGINRVTETACATACTGTGKSVVCLTNADCPAATPTCGASILLEGFGTCR